jgi:succinate-acetate transporter protein
VGGGGFSKGEVQSFQCSYSLLWACPVGVTLQCKSNIEVMKSLNSSYLGYFILCHTIFTIMFGLCYGAHKNNTTRQGTANMSVMLRNSGK